jgi:hypothetical protein
LGSVCRMPALSAGIPGGALRASQGEHYGSLIPMSVLRRAPPSYLRLMRGWDWWSGACSSPIQLLHKRSICLWAHTCVMSVCGCRCNGLFQLQTPQSNEGTGLCQGRTLPAGNPLCAGNSPIPMLACYTCAAPAAGGQKCHSCTASAACVEVARIAERPNATYTLRRTPAARTALLARHVYRVATGVGSKYDGACVTQSKPCTCAVGVLAVPGVWRQTRNRRWFGREIGLRGWPPLQVHTKA